MTTEKEKPMTEKCHHEGCESEGKYKTTIQDFSQLNYVCWKYLYYCSQHLPRTPAEQATWDLLQGMEKRLQLLETALIHPPTVVETCCGGKMPSDVIRRLEKEIQGSWSGNSKDCKVLPNKMDAVYVDNRTFTVAPTFKEGDRVKVKTGNVHAGEVGFISLDKGLIDIVVNFAGGMRCHPRHTLELHPGKFKAGDRIVVQGKNVNPAFQNKLGTVVSGPDLTDAYQVDMDEEIKDPSPFGSYDGKRRKWTEDRLQPWTEQKLTPEFLAAAEIEANTPITVGIETTETLSWLNIVGSRGVPKDQLEKMQADEKEVGQPKKEETWRDRPSML